MDRKTIKGIIGRLARDRVNEAVGRQNEVTAAVEFRDAFDRANDIIDKAEAAAETLRSLDAEIESKQKTLTALDERARNTTTAYKPAMIELDNREKQIAAREAAIVAHEEKQARRDEETRQLESHVASYGKSDA